MRKVFVALLVSLLILPSFALGAVNSVTLLDQKGYMPSWLFLFIAAGMVVTLIVSYRWKDEMCGFISVMLSFASMWTSRAVDYTTGISIDTSGDITIIHTIYHPDILTVFSVVCFILSLLNLYRVYLLSKQGASGFSEE